MSIGGIANIVGLLGAAATGFMRGRQARIDQDAQLADQQFRQDQQQQQRDQWARDASLRSDLAAASQPVTMAQAGGKPDTMDNSDVGQVGEQPVMPNTYTVGTRQFTDQGQAQKALDDANAPSGQASRVAAAYLKNGQAGMALQAQRDAQQAELTQLGLQEKHREIANQMFDDLLGQQGTHDALASYISNAAWDGQGGALKVKAVPSADGKSVTYNRVNPDGTLTPTGHTYSNDDAGVQQAQLWLSRATPLAAKIQNLHQQAQDKLAAEKEASEAKERAARADYYAAMGDAAGEKADKYNGGKGGNTYDRMSEADKQAAADIFKQREALTKQINDGVAGGSMKEGDDAFKFLDKQRRALDIQARTIASKYGSGAPAPDPLGLRGAPRAGMVVSAQDQAARDKDAGQLMIANEFGGDVSKAQSGVKQYRDAAASADGDAKAILLGQADRLQAGIDAMKSPSPAASPVPAADSPPDPSMRRVATTPVVNFNPRSPVNTRIANAQAQLPALQAAVEQTAAAVKAAQGRGPMAVAAARNAWSNARSALHEAQVRAGLVSDDTTAEE